MEEKFSAENAPKEEKYSVNKRLPKGDRKFTWQERNQIIKTGKSFKYKSLIFSTAPQSHWQLIITLKGTFKGAVARNRTKRIIREVYRNCKPLFNSTFGVAVTVLKNPGRLDYHKLMQVYKKHLLNS